MATRPSRDLELFPNPQPQRDYTIRIRIRTRLIAFLTATNLIPMFSLARGTWGIAQSVADAGEALAAPAVEGLAEQVVEHRVDLGHHVLAVDVYRIVGTIAQGHVQHRAVLGVVYFFTVKHAVAPGFAPGDVLHARHVHADVQRQPAVQLPVAPPVQCHQCRAAHDQVEDPLQQRVVPGIADVADHHGVDELLGFLAAHRGVDCQSAKLVFVVDLERSEFVATGEELGLSVVAVDRLDVGMLGANDALVVLYPKHDLPIEAVATMHYLQMIILYNS